MRKSKKGFYVLKGSVFPYDIVFCFGTTEQDILTHFDKRFIDGLSIKDKDNIHNHFGHGLTLRLENRAMLVWLKKYPQKPSDFDYLSHEIFHAAYAILDKAGVVCSDDSEEAYAYLIGWITQNVYREFGFA